MIAIINRGGQDDGVCTYTVGINKEVIATFDHDRRDGLEVCLRKAADAVKKQRIWNYWEDLIRDTAKPRI